VEAVNNSIVHGNKEDVNKRVFLSLHMDEDTVQILVEDQGEGFDYTNLPDPTKPENLENIHGRGIYLIKHLADEVEFYKNGTVVQMNFKV
jgi:serine/threonine-protein kinase RsbW